MDASTFRPEEVDWIRILSFIAAVGAQYRSTEMSDLETEELEWFPDRRPAAALVRQMREKHRKPTNSAAHARPWRFLFKPRVGRNSLLFQEDGLTSVKFRL